MKRVGFLYDKVCDLGNIKLAIYNASKDKRNRPEVKRCLDNMDETAKAIQTLLRTKTFKSGKYYSRMIIDNGTRKVREITIPKFYPDQIIHWSLMQVLSPILVPYYSENTCASIKGRGTYYAQKRVNKALKDIKGTKYYLKLDIHHCYPSIKKHIAIKAFEKKIKDPDVIWLIGEILNACDTGIPIGFYTSQWIANTVLTPLDRFIESRPEVKHYVRYLDDMIIFGSNKRKLHKLLNLIQEEVGKLELELKHNYQLYNFDKQGLDFVGIRFFRQYSIIRKRTFKNLRRLVLRTNKFKEPTTKQARKFLSYYGWLKRTNLHRWYATVCIPSKLNSKSRRVVSSEDKRLLGGS